MADYPNLILTGKSIKSSYLPLVQHTGSIIVGADGNRIILLDGTASSAISASSAYSSVFSVFANEASSAAEASFAFQAGTASIADSSSFSFFADIAGTAHISDLADLAANATNATSASYAITASYALNAAGGGGGGQSDTASYLSGSVETLVVVTSSVGQPGNPTITGLYLPVLFQGAQYWIQLYDDEPPV